MHRARHTLPHSVPRGPLATIRIESGAVVDRLTSQRGLQPRMLLEF